VRGIAAKKELLKEKWRAVKRQVFLPMRAGSVLEQKRKEI
jgi:hypothetical protein